MAPTVSPSVPVAGDNRFASAIVAGAASGFHVLRIEGYSGTKFTIPNGQHVESHPFRVAGHTWTIRYYPNGNCPQTEDYISLYLVLKETIAKHLMVHLVLSFIDQVDKQRPSYVRGLKPDRFGSHGSWGREKFVKRTELEQSERLRDDCFTVRCDIIVLSEPRAEAARLRLPASSFVTVPPPDWSEHFRELLLGGKGADVRFVVGGETFAAHRCVLAARSPVFDAMLLGPMKEGTTTQNQNCIPVTIDGMVPQVFRSLLHFIYTDSLPPETEGQGNTDDGATMSQHLLEAADRYGMQRLKLICEDRLCRHIDVTTVATTLALADQHGCRGLKEACYEFLKSSKSLDAVMGTDGFQHLVKSCPSALFELMSKLASH
ncbi:BTB/POZ and MATH domain-containing protein 2-like [Miscanthus floridulus]|uniref:BTB/POZ and MATH domain-containing protein 2-like n=1 Tax=Miscanthus floridulus TaxID=154761 RepID=UPI003458464F